MLLVVSAGLYIETMSQWSKLRSHNQIEIVVAFVPYLVGWSLRILPKSMHRRHSDVVFALVPLKAEPDLRMPYSLELVGQVDPVLVVTGR